MCCSRDWLTIISCRARSRSFVSPLKRLYFLPSFSTCGIFGISMLQPRYYKDFNAPASINQITLNSSPLSIQKTTMRVIEEHLLRREVFRTYCHTALHTSVVKIEASQIYSPMLTTTPDFQILRPLVYSKGHGDALKRTGDDGQEEQVYLHWFWSFSKHFDRTFCLGSA